MANYNSNGIATGLDQYETPFSDITIVKEYTNEKESAGDVYTNYFQEGESPFLRTYETTNATRDLNPAGEEFVNFLAELNDTEFSEAVFELTNEVEDTWRNKVSNEVAMGSNYIPFATQQAREYMSPLIAGTENMIDQVAQQFSGNNLADHSEASIESFFSNFDYGNNQYTPAQEQFFGKIFDKVKSVVKKGVDLAKKGIAAVGKLLPLNIVLKKIKGLIKPLLDKVLKFAIGKLPQKLQPYAQTLAKKFLHLETSEMTANTPPSENEMDAIQTELDNYMAQLVFSPGENEASDLLVNYEMSYENLDRTNNYETGYSNAPSLDTAREQFINELKELQSGESPAPAIEKFLPAAILALQPVIKIAITLIGRQKVINFLAGLLAKLVSKYVPANVAKPLAASIIDVGMGAIGFEVHETGKADLAYEAIANTIEETVQQMGNLEEASLGDTENLSMQLLEAFEVAAANNFPAQYIKEQLRPTKHKAIWVGMPRNSAVKLYKKFTHIYDITIDPQTAAAVKTFRDLPLINFLKDKYGLDTTKPVNAKVHLYETRRGTRLNQISKFEKLPGLNAQQQKAWVQLLPLTETAATLLLKEPALGKTADNRSLSTRFRTKTGSRFYYLEIEGARLRIPIAKPVAEGYMNDEVQDQRRPQAMDNRNMTLHSQAVKRGPGRVTESRSADIQGVINFIKSEITIAYYFSEEDAKAVVEKLNGNDFLGAAINIRHSLKTVLHEMLSRNIQSKVKIVHESMPELYLENITEEEDEFNPLGILGKIAGKEIISKLVKKLIDKISKQAYEAVADFFKTRATEFKTAQAQPTDGVTIKITWNNVQGMSAIRTLISAIRGKLSIGSLGDLALPKLSTPAIKIEAGKKFN